MSCVFLDLANIQIVLKMFSEFSVLFLNSIRMTETYFRLYFDDWNENIFGIFYVEHMNIRWAEFFPSVTPNRSNLTENIDHDFDAFS